MSKKAQVLNFLAPGLSETLEELVLQPMYNIGQSAPEWPERGEEQHQIIFFQSAAAYIACQLSQGVKLNKAQNQWLALASFITNKQKQNRKFIRLIDLDLMLQDSEQLADVLTQYNIAYDESKLDDMKSEVPGLEFVAARQRVLAFEDLADLDALLRASSLPSSSEQPVDVEAFLAQEKQRESERQQQIVEAEAQCRRYEEKLESTLSKAKAFEERAKEAEQQSKEKQSKAAEVEKQLREELERMQGKADELEAQINKSEHQREQQAEENELLLSQLQQVQEELEGAFIKAKAFEERAKEAEQQSKEKQSKAAEVEKQLREELERIQSKAGELEAQINKSEHQRQQQAEENELLLLQLQQVQEELENYFIRVKELEQSAAKPSIHSQPKLNTEAEDKLRRDIERKNAKLHDFSQKMKALRADNKALKASLKEQQEELAQLQQRAIITANLPAVIEQPKPPKTRIPSRFLKMVKLPFGTKPEPKEQREFKRQKQILIDSGMFDEAYYLKQNPDVANSSVEPVEHYLKYGGFEGRKPRADFDSAFYLKKYPDVREGKLNPLLHYVMYGVHEKRKTKN